MTPPEQAAWDAGRDVGKVFAHVSSLGPITIHDDHIAGEHRRDWLLGLAVGIHDELAATLTERAPQVQRLIAALPAGDWGADELGTLANWLAEQGFTFTTEED